MVAAFEAFGQILILNIVTMVITRKDVVTPVIFLFVVSSAAISRALHAGRHHEHDNFAGAHYRRRCDLRSEESRCAIHCAEGRTRDARNNAVADLHRVD
jgi:hypothetical protein